MGDIEFIDGLIVKAPNPKAPDFVKASLSIKREELITWLQSKDGEWVNVDIKEAKSGKWYAAVNAYKAEGDKPQRQESKPAHQAPAGNDFADDEIPF